MEDDENDDIFAFCNDKYSDFHLIENKLSQRPDLHAFMLLDRLVPGDEDMISAAEHDEFFLSITPAALLAVATKDQLVELHRCGVRHDPDYDSLRMNA